MLVKINKELVRILSLSVSNMILYSAYNTMLNMQKIIVSSISEDKPNFLVEGYTVSGLLYTTFSICLWFGPYVNYALGPKLTMTLAAFGYLFYIGSYTTEYEWLIYVGAAIVGMSAGCLWPAQGHYLIENSTSQTLPRNASIFWLILTLSYAFGNIYVYFEFTGKKYINQSTRRSVVFFLVAVNVLAIVTLIALPKSINNNETKDFTLIKTIKKSWSMLISKKMLWLALIFSCTGFQSSFMDGIHGPSIGFTLAFGDSAKSLVALGGIFMTIGSILGAIFPIIFAGWIRKHHFARRLIVLFGCIILLIAYFIIFINLPNNANFGNTDQISLIQPSVVLAMLCSVLLNFGDMCMNTQIYSIIGEAYRETSAEACALFKFIQSISMATSYYYSSHIGLHTQVAMLSVMGVVGVTGFFMADRNREESICNNRPDVGSSDSNETCTPK